MNEIQIALEHHRSGDLLLAKYCYDNILNHEPENHNILHLLGVVYHQLGNNSLAVRLISRAIGINPNVADYYNNLGEVFRDMGLLDESILCYEIAITIDVKNVKLYSNLARSLTEKGSINKAIEVLNKYLELDPNNAFIHHDLSLLYLSNGNFLNGWLEYEWRIPCFKEQRVFDKPRLDGSDISGKSILLYTEQGFGDTIQFIRYVSLVKKLGVKVIVECQRELKSLFQGVSGIDILVSRGDSLPYFDYQVPLMSLPFVFKTSLSSIPNCVPYIKPSSCLVQQWSRKFQFQKCFKVGLVWAGNSVRNISLSDFAPFGLVSDVCFYSLQVGRKSEEALNPPSGLVLLDLTKDINDFCDTAAIIENLDLVITVDTAVAHLAGALNMPVWLLLPFVPDWRWMLFCSDSPWYPSMKIFRQSHKGMCWSSVVKLVVDELQKLVKLSYEEI